MGDWPKRKSTETVGVSATGGVPNEGPQTYPGFQSDGITDGSLCHRPSGCHHFLPNFRETTGTSLKSVFETCGMSQKLLFLIKEAKEDYASPL